MDLCTDLVHEILLYLPYRIVLNTVGINSEHWNIRNKNFYKFNQNSIIKWEDYRNTYHKYYFTLQQSIAAHSINKSWVNILGICAYCRYHYDRYFPKLLEYVWSLSIHIEPLLVLTEYLFKHIDDLNFRRNDNNLLFIAMEKSPQLALLLLNNGYEVLCIDVKNDPLIYVISHSMFNDAYLQLVNPILNNMYSRNHKVDYVKIACELSNKKMVDILIKRLNYSPSECQNVLLGNNTLDNFEIYMRLESYK